MRTLKSGLTIARAAIFSIALFFGSALCGQTNTHFTKGGPHDNAAIHTDVTAINRQKAKVDELKKKLKDDCKAGNKEAAIMDKKELRKARAELKKERTYLVADAKDVASDDALVLSDCKKTLRKDESDLKACRKELSKAEKNGDHAAIKSEKDKVAALEKRVEEDKANLDKEKRKRADDMSFMKKEVKQLEGPREWYYMASL